MMKSVHRLKCASKKNGFFFQPIVCLIISILVGMILLVCVNLLPQERIKNHVRDGAAVILQEHAECQYAEGYVESILDNYTDALILSKVVYPSDHPLKDAVLVPSYSFPGQDVEGMQLFGTLNDNPLEDAQIDTYARYWHGYLVFLKPFFCFFSYADFRIFNQAVELVLILVVVVLMQKRNLGSMIPGYIAMIVLWNPGTMGVSLQYAPCFYVSIGASLIILGRDGLTADFRQDLFLFLFCGILTAYLDFLTYPIATLGLPLSFGILSEEANNKKKSKKGLIGKSIRICMTWGIGYLGMWAGKWMLGSLLSGENIINDAFQNIVNRTSTKDGEQSFSRFGVVIYLIRYTFGKRPYLLLMLILLIVLAGYIFCHREQLIGPEIVFKKVVHSDKGTIMTLILVGTLPFFWYFITANHSFIHPRLVYRSMGVTVFAWISALTMIIRKCVWRKTEK